MKTIFSPHSLNGLRDISHGVLRWLTRCLGVIAMLAPLAASAYTITFAWDPSPSDPSTFTHYNVYQCDAQGCTINDPGVVLFAQPQNNVTTVSVSASHTGEKWYFMSACDRVSLGIGGCAEEAFNPTYICVDGARVGIDPLAACLGLQPPENFRVTGVQ